MRNGTKKLFLYRNEVCFRHYVEVSSYYILGVSYLKAKLAFGGNVIFGANLTT